MKQAFLEKLESRGYWRVNFRPLAPPSAPLTLKQCLEVVQRNEVSLRGWNYPHVPSTHPAGQEDAIRRLEKAVEAQTDWGTHKEFWRMYVSTQFIHYRAVAEDWRSPDVFEESTEPPKEPVLGVVYHAWTLTEIFEFLERLKGAGLYQDGAEVSITLGNTAGRVLRVDDLNRAPLTGDYRTNAVSITYKVELTGQEIESPKDRAVDAVLYFWEKFGFEPSRDQVIGVVDDLYRIRW